MAAEENRNNLSNQEDQAEAIAKHIAGATVGHQHPFESLAVPVNPEALSQAFIQQWVLPFYHINLAFADAATLTKFAKAACEISPVIVQQLLGAFNWPTRITGAFFSAINRYEALEELIGKLLLKSEVCYAGAGYCLALVSLGTANSQHYLRKYLEYYLEQKHLWFDQADALCALELLDPEQAVEMQDKWNDYAAGKGLSGLARSREHFRSCLSVIDRIREKKERLDTGLDV